MGSALVHTLGIKALSEIGFTADLEEVPNSYCMGEDDQVVPFATSGKMSANILQGAKLIS